MRMRFAAPVLLIVFLLGFLPLRSSAFPAEFSCDGVSGIPAAECEVLVVLYNLTDGPNWLHSMDWLATNTPCSWYGVSCDSSGHVDSVELTSNNLSGSIPSELANLGYLVSLGLGWNHLTGGIPPELGNMPQLVWLHLDHNQLSGSIPPELASLGELVWLNLAVNQLSGEIPPELGALPSLLSLSLNGNQLTGQIPHELGDLTALEDLYVSETELSGSLPHSLTNLIALETFWFHESNLCEPPDALFQNWLDGIPDLMRSGDVCDWASLYMPLIQR